MKFDEYSGESDSAKDIKKIIKQLKEKKLLKKSKGALIVNLKKYNLGVCLIQKSDGTTIYAVRDIATAIKRHKKYKFKKMIYEVGQEQKLYFKQLFKVLELMGYGWAKDCVHVDHGFYLDKDGKKFATRKGKTIFMEDIIDKTISLAKKEIKKRFPKISEEELEDRALKIAIAAIFYGDLKNNRLNNIVFDIERFVSFEGDTGPYIQYSYARASSILRKTKNKDKLNITGLEPKEFELVKKLSQFPEIVLTSYAHLNPAIIANYSYQLAQIFNEFYHACPVINSEQESFRLALIEAFRQVLKNSLGLLGVKTVKEM
ncbi:Arginine--tRNA ligase [subsurface metagenome]